MTEPPPGDGRPRGDLEATLMRELGLDKAQPRHTTLKLQPVVLPPPPTETALPPPEAMTEAGASADDDIPLENESGGRGRGPLIGAGVALLLAVGIGIGWFSLKRDAPRPEASIPTIQAPQPAELKGPAPPEPASAASTATAPAEPPADKSMAEIATELTPPSTEGLSPARKVNATRIIVENDREVRTLR